MTFRLWAFWVLSMNCVTRSHAESRLSVCRVYFTPYSTDCIIQYAVFSTLVSSGFLCECVHALLCNVFYKVYSTVHRTLLCLSSPVLCECAKHCSTLYSTEYSVMYTVFYSLFSPLRLSVKVRVCSALRCIL